MPKLFVYLTFLFFIITAFTGIIMRGMPFEHHLASIPYENILHGHSQIALLGWCFLGVFLVFVAVFWTSFPNKKEIYFIIFTLFVVTIIMFIAFLINGYGLPSIILSTVHIFLEYWVIWFIYKHLKRNLHISKVSSLFIKGSLIALFISTLAPFSLGAIAASGLRDSHLFDMVIYFYLHFQYNGWLFFFLIGMFLIILEKKNIPIQTKLISIGFWIYAIALIPGYLLSVLWADLGFDVSFIAMLGGVGQWVGILYLLIALWNVWKHVVDAFSNFIVFWLNVTLILLLVKSTMELGLIFPAISNSVYDTRSIIVGYLHLTLLGFVSIFTMAQYQMLDILDTKQKWMRIGFIIFFIGFCINEMFLFAMGLATWMNIYLIPMYLEGLLVASILLFIGITILTISIYKRKSIS